MGEIPASRRGFKGWLFRLGAGALSQLSASLCGGNPKLSALMVGG